MTEHVTGEFEMPEAAQAAVQGLLDERIDSDEISVSVENPSGLHLIAVRHVDGVVRGGLWGLGIGLAAGGLLAGLVVTGLVHHDALDFLLEGTVPGVLRGAVMGGVAGFLLGLVRALLQDSEGVTVPPARLHPGRVTIAVDADRLHAQHARETLRRFGAEHVAG